MEAEPRDDGERPDEPAASPPLPPKFRWATEVRDEDIDMLGHASNLSFVRWVQDVALAHSEDVGLGLERYRQLGGVFVVRRHELEYLRPAMLGDRLEVATWIATSMAAKAIRATEIVRLHDGVMLCRATTTWGFVDVTSGRPTRIPREVRSAFYGAPPSSQT